MNERQQLEAGPRARAPYRAQNLDQNGARARTPVAAFVVVVVVVVVAVDVVANGGEGEGTDAVVDDDVNEDVDDDGGDGDVSIRTWCEIPPARKNLAFVPPPQVFSC